VLIASACADAPPPLERIVLVSLDTLRADQLEAYGYPRGTSPAIREMAAAGVRFANVVAASSWTLPGHASMLTGLDAAGHRTFSFHKRSMIPDSVVTLPERLREHGFRTAAFVGGVFVSRRQGFDRGFEVFADPQPARVLPGRIRETWDGGIAWLREQRDERAFLFLHTYQIHTPYLPPAPYDRIFDAQVPGPQRVGFRRRDLEPDSWAHRALERPEMVEQLRKLYDGEIRFADDFVGELLQVLRDEDWAERSCVVLTSDHGEEFGEHGELFHDSAKLVQELIEVPLIFWCPGRLPPGRVVTEPVGVVDVAPTLLDLAGLPVPEGLDGISLLPQMLGESRAGSRPLVSDVDLSVENRFLPLAVQR
jgi:arylsulfatase A-like enzyme